MSAPRLLVIGWGNPARGDDALGPLFVEQLAARVPDAPVTWLTDYQLQVEHALDLAGCRQVLFVDASLVGAAPYHVEPVQPARDASFTTHALSPAAVLRVAQDIGVAVPPARLLAIRGDCFELGAPLGERAAAHLGAALRWGEQWLREELAPCTS